MKKMLLLILSLPPFWACGQLSDDSLKKNVDRSPFPDYWGVPLQTGAHPLTLYSTEELFPGYFNNVKIFIAAYYLQNGPIQGGFFPKFCAVDVSTGQAVKFIDTVAFYHFVNSANKKISNLDKAYLYLFLFRNILNSTEWLITQPGAYKQELGANSIFLGKDADKIFLENYAYDLAYPYCFFMNDKQRNNEIHNSTDTSLVIYAFEGAMSRDYDNIHSSGLPMMETASIT